MSPSQSATQRSGKNKNHTANYTLNNTKGNNNNNKGFMVPPNSGAVQQQQQQQAHPQHIPSAGTNAHRRNEIVRRRIEPIRFKTRICKHFLETGLCPFEPNCAFAHGGHELRTIQENALVAPPLNPFPATHQHLPAAVTMQATLPAHSRTSDCMNHLTAPPHLSYPLQTSHTMYPTGSVPTSTAPNYSCSCPGCVSYYYNNTTNNNNSYYYPQEPTTATSAALYGKTTPACTTTTLLPPSRSSVPSSMTLPEDYCYYAGGNCTLPSQCPCAQCVPLTSATTAVEIMPSTTSATAPSSTTPIEQDETDDILSNISAASPGIVSYGEYTYSTKVCLPADDTFVSNSPVMEEMMAIP